MTTMQGKFFVIDGTNGSGKATQTKLLIERMRKEGLPVLDVSFPRYGEKSAGMVEEYLQGAFGTPEDVGSRRASIFYACDRFAASGSIRAALEEGTHVVADRYVASNMGHQGSTIADRDDRMTFYRWNDELEFGLFGIPRPDANVILHVPAEVTMRLMDERGEKKDLHENLAHQQAAERTYLEIAETFDGFRLIRCVEEGNLLSPEQIHEKVWQALSPLL